MNKPLKRGTKIRIGDAKPTWIFATYERLPSFCFWCGKLGHTYKDCYNYDPHEKKVAANTMPYGEWMKASPMKLTHVTPGREMEGNEGFRRSLFPVSEIVRDNVAVDDSNTQPKNDTDDRTAAQVTELLHILEKVEVGNIKENSRGGVSMKLTNPSPWNIVAYPTPLPINSANLN